MCIHVCVAFLLALPFAVAKEALVINSPSVSLIESTF
jgi:hypothetical protein